MTRSLCWLSMARGYLAEAEHSLERGGDSGVRASTAYYAMLYAARAALREERRVARKHGGTWQLMRELFVESRAVLGGARGEGSGDGGRPPGRGLRRGDLQPRDERGPRPGARRSVERIDRLIGAEPPDGGAG
jgi:hypothetical protein